MSSNFSMKIFVYRISVNYIDSSIDVLMGLDQAMIQSGLRERMQFLPSMPLMSESQRIGVTMVTPK